MSSSDPGTDAEHLTGMAIAPAQVLEGALAPTARDTWRGTFPAQSNGHLSRGSTCCPVGSDNCARNETAAGGETRAAPDGGGRFSLIMTAEPHKDPIKARTIKARVQIARRGCQRYSCDTCCKDVARGFAGPSTLRSRSASARPGRDAERSKTGMVCLGSPFIPDGLVTSGWLTMHDPDKRLSPLRHP